jgi:phenylacetic acid degradation operon negative regulatory protein
MLALRRAELREGVWVRPDNLLTERPATLLEQCSFFTCQPEEEPVALAAALWDLEAWASEARQLRSELGAARTLTDGFLVTAKVLRHLLVDPVLPPELLPKKWPAIPLREEFGQFEVEYAARLRAYSDEGDGAT